ncbi:PTS transporter subunit EIIC [Enterococcus sp. AZ109]|uniref:PTS transporter subunit EIIC n=1 Tax=Enterococcus sp. AZ109 TaxID=2774634 RepID=UPI003F2047C6
MKKDLTKDAVEIIRYVGGKENINGLTHCVTRLRFILENESLINEVELKKVGLVKGVIRSNGQYQVIIGPGTVDKVFAEVEAMLGKKEVSAEPNTGEGKTNVLQRGLKNFSDIFIPILPAIIGAGMLLGIGNIMTASGIFGPDSLVVSYPAIQGLAEMILMIANTAFTYIPVLVAWSATKRFGGSPILGILLGLVLINADLLSGSQMSGVISGSIEPEYWSIFGLDIMKIGYQNSVLPPLVASYVLVLLEKTFRKFVPGALQMIVIPPVSILISAFLTFLVIGPTMNQLSTWITDSILYLFDFSPIFAGLLFGLLWQPLVVTGMHHAFIAINIQLIAATQQSYMLSIITIVCVAEAGADFAMALLAKNKADRGIALSAGTSSLLGVTEPSMFGITIPAKFPFIFSIISSGIAGVLIMLSKIYAVSLGPSGPLSFTIIPIQFWTRHYMIMFLAFVLSFGSTYAYGKFVKQKKTVPTTETSSSISVEN